MQFSLEKRLEKRKWIHLTHHRYQLMDCVIKWNSRFINSIRSFFICLKIFIMQRRKNRCSEKWYILAKIYIKVALQQCVLDHKTDSKSKWVKTLAVWLCCLNYLVYLWRYLFAILCCCTICLIIWCMQSEPVTP